MNRMIALCLSAALLPAHALANQPLSKEEVVSIFTDKSFDIVLHTNNSRFSGYGAPDGTLLILRNGKIEPGRTWFVNDKGQRCATDPAWNDKPAWKDGRCFDVIDAGGGTYHQLEEGKHIHTLTNFRSGKQL